MLKLLLILIIFCLHKGAVLSDTSAKLPEKITYRLDDIHDLFKGFVTQYNKTYSSEELDHRRNVFVDNLVKINRWNREHSTAVFGIGPFTDLTFEEFTEMYTGTLSNFTTDNAMKIEPGENAPEILDWRQNGIVTRVKDQKNCGCSHIFSVVGTIESQYAMHTGELLELSEQQIFDCYAERGCNFDAPHRLIDSLVNEACGLESDFPYLGKKTLCIIPMRPLLNIKKGGYVLPASEEALKDILASYGPVSIVIGSSDEMRHLRGGLYIPKEECNQVISVLLVGYAADGDTPYWLIKNSWGIGWNEAGYLRMIRGKKACGIGQYAALAIVDPTQQN